MSGQETDADERITRLEETVAHQSLTIEELSDVIARQSEQIHRMERALKQLGENFLALEERTAPDVPVTKPPHY